MKDEVFNKLYDSFELKEREGLGGMKFKYIASTDIIDRMNRTFKGKWSTEVTSQERQDDFVVVRVKVSAYDEESKTWFSHDGYGSSTIMRYAGGQKAGQIIDLGNAYKSAEAKAIKNACTRWGVGLYLEGASEDEGAHVATTPPGGGPESPSPMMQPTLDNITPPPFPENNGDPIPAVAPPVPEMPPAEEPKAKEAAPPVPETAPVETPPVQQNNVTQEDNGPKNITDVQKVAIQGLLQIKAAMFADIPENERFGKLVSDALGRTDDLPSSPEGLSYQDAVAVIKYGNEIDKK